MTDVAHMVHVADRAASWGFSAPAGMDHAGEESTPRLRDRSLDMADAVLGHGFSLSRRLHVLPWGNERNR